ncbi:MAG: hypothetical protein FWD57_01800, partial [Polyangiaceae bacterium]|nr:hypothetical protein [Polyangiaceae bacterium]
MKSFGSGLLFIAAILGLAAAACSDGELPTFAGTGGVDGGKNNGTGANDNGGAGGSEVGGGGIGGGGIGGGGTGGGGVGGGGIGGDGGDAGPDVDADVDDEGGGTVDPDADADPPDVIPDGPDGDINDTGTDGPVCGNGVIEPGEQCDGEQFGTASCIGYGLGPGDLLCTSECTISTENCAACPFAPIGTWEGFTIGQYDVDLCTGSTLYNGEACTSGAATEGNELLFTVKVPGHRTVHVIVDKYDNFEASLWAANSCADYEAASCVAGIANTNDGAMDLTNTSDDEVEWYLVVDALDGAQCGNFDIEISGDVPPGCGDGVATWDPDNDIYEQCDQSDLAGKTCKDLGFDGGDLGCFDICTFDTVGCWNGVPPDWNCDDDKYNDGTVCDCGCGYLDPDCGSQLSGACDTCSEAGSCAESCDHIRAEENWLCVDKPAECGNGVLDLKEECDGGLFHSVFAEGCGFYGHDFGNLTCSSWCLVEHGDCHSCGNGKVNLPDEACDGLDLNGQSCVTQGFETGQLLCNTDCTFDTSECSHSKCGNREIDEGEECDGNNLGGKDCDAIGFSSGGRLACNSECKWDITDCWAKNCGNGEVDSPWEVCDGDIYPPLSCVEHLMLGDGYVKCTDCQFDISECETCGNGTVEGTDQCDGADINGVTCADFGYSGGGLPECNLDCTFNIESCKLASCGNGVLDPGEDCDGTAFGPQTCNSRGFGLGDVKCTDGCMYDFSECTNCGTGVVDDIREQCDGMDLNGQSCATQGRTGGSLGCDSDCRFDFSACTTCNDGVIEGDEQCEGTNLQDATCASIGFTTGMLSCNPASCMYNTSLCTTCGDGKIEGYEDCEGTDLNGKTCADLGYADGELACNLHTCQFDQTNCNSCGNGTIQPGEECDYPVFTKSCVDEGYAPGQPTCNTDCTIDWSSCADCGNGALDDAEDCDGTIIPDVDCAGLGYVSGPLICNDCAYDITQCVSCGNNRIDSEFGEVCDGDALNSMDCQSIPDARFTGGTLGCKTDCTGYDTTGCWSCGDGAVNDGEECDSSNLDGKTCAILGFDGGDLSCMRSCLFDTSGCYSCQDGVVNPTEDCDSDDINGKRCADLPGFDGGTLKCNNATCVFDTSECFACGDGAVNDGEECDSGNLGGVTCADLAGFDGGTLKCFDSQCKYDTSACYFCGDGTVNAPAEQCDSNNLNGATCASIGMTGGDLACNNAFCTFDVSDCYTCGNGALEPHEKCEPGNMFGKVCGDVVPGTVGNLKCRADCLEFDTSECTRCGNGTVDPGEDCDPAGTLTDTCESSKLNLVNGTLSCNPDCTFNTSLCLRCGNGVIDSPGEDCDGSDFGGLTCVDYDHAPGALICNNCKIDDSGCGDCGNGVAQPHEQCDLTDLKGAIDCSDIGLVSGVLSCGSDCNYDTSLCESCGNSVIDLAFGEVCDNLNFGGKTCMTEMDADWHGTLLCIDSCKTINTDNCFRCGDGAVNPGEVCDLTEFSGSTCETIKGANWHGTLKCTDKCTNIDSSECRECGNNVLELGELCDTTRFGVQTCASMLGPNYHGSLDCLDQCTRIGTESCNECGDGSIDPGEKCDTLEFGTNTCASINGEYWHGSLECKNMCQDIDSSGCHFCGDGDIDPGEECDGNKPCSEVDGPNYSGTAICGQSTQCKYYNKTGCEPGCVDDGKFSPIGAERPSNTCESCVSVGNWVYKGQSAQCDNASPGRYCNADKCSDGCLDVGGVFVPFGTTQPSNFCYTCGSGGTFVAKGQGTQCDDHTFCNASNDCQIGCQVNSVFYAPETIHPTDPCQICPIGGGQYVPRGQGTGCGGTGDYCDSGNVCSKGCLVGSVFYPEKSIHPTDKCQICPEGGGLYGPRGEGTLCDGNMFCNSSDKCMPGCAIGGSFYDPNTVHPTDKCQYCPPGGGDFGPRGQGTSCDVNQYCDALDSCKTGCAIGSVFYGPNVLHPVDKCQICPPGGGLFEARGEGTQCGSVTEYCNQDDQCVTGCVVDSVFYAPEAVHPVDKCMKCAPGGGGFVGRGQATPCGDPGWYCNTSDFCTPGCVIGNTFYPPNGPHPTDGCLVCPPGGGNFAPRPVGTGCGTTGLEYCDTDNNCSAGCAIGNSFYEPDTVHPTDKCQICPAVGGTFTPRGESTSCIPPGFFCDALHKCEPGCVIGSKFYPETTIHPTDDCQICPVGGGTFSPRGQGVSCGEIGQYCNAAYQCRTGCVADSVFYEPGADDPADICRICPPSGGSFVNKPFGTGCGTGFFCSPGCDKGCMDGSTFVAAGTEPADTCKFCPTGGGGLIDKGPGAPCGEGFCDLLNQCSDGCEEGGYIPPGGPRPSNPCQVCAGGNSWVAKAPAGSGCGANSYCIGIDCTPGCQDKNGSIVLPTYPDQMNCRTCDPGGGSWTTKLGGSDCAANSYCVGEDCVVGCRDTDGSVKLPNGLASNKCERCAAGGGSWNTLTGGSDCDANSYCVGTTCTPGCKDTDNSIKTPPQIAIDKCRQCTTTGWNTFVAGTECGTNLHCFGNSCEPSCKDLNGTVKTPGQLDDAKCRQCTTTGWNTFAAGTGCGTHSYCVGSTCSGPGCWNGSGVTSYNTANPGNSCQYCSSATGTWANQGVIPCPGGHCNGSSCDPGCVANGSFYGQDAGHPNDPCQRCSGTNWVPRSTGESCGTSAQICSSSGSCVTVPPAWTCSTSEYLDPYCDCGCGAPDPACGPGGGCTPDRCTDPTCNFCHASTGTYTKNVCGGGTWTCLASWFLDGICDCNCGL